jgi:AraC-like DNA-binding protein
MTGISQSPFGRLSSDELPERNRAEMVHDMYVRTIYKHERKPLGDEPIRCAAKIYSLPGLGLSSVSVSPVLSWSPRDTTSDDVVFNLMLRGARHVVQRGREVTVRGGDAELMTTDPAVSMIRDSHFLSFRLRRAELGPMTANLDDCAMRPIKSSVAKRLLPQYLGALEEAAESTVEARELAVSHVYDIVALALGANRDTAELAARRGLRAVRLRAIKDDILANLGDESLSISAVAVRQGITPRYVSMLFDGIGTSFSNFVLGQRLARARRMLTAARYRGRTISAIAYSCGFGDLSYFNKAFRRAFGATPSDLRAIKRADDA